ncbi:MAG: flippase-like domain-containing protein, partial [Chloroflexota bacterium]|nr:flippase-like domain-containing protein [Chloroflexota bacterium]
VLRRPEQALRLFGGTAGLTLTYALTLYISLLAFGVAPSPLKVAAVYLGGTALASLSPTPGGLGAAEAALVAGLTVFDVPGGAAVAGVLTYRLITFWLPIVPGLAGLRYLQRQGIV